MNKNTISNSNMKQSDYELIDVRAVPLHKEASRFVVALKKHINIGCASGKKGEYNYKSIINLVHDIQESAKKEDWCPNVSTYTIFAAVQWIEAEVEHSKFIEKYKLKSNRDGLWDALIWMQTFISMVHKDGIYVKQIPQNYDE